MQDRPIFLCDAVLLFPFLDVLLRHVLHLAEVVLDLGLLLLRCGRHRTFPAAPNRRLNEFHHGLADEQADHHGDEETENRPDHPQPQLFDVVAERHAGVREQVVVVAATEDRDLHACTSINDASVAGTTARAAEKIGLMRMIRRAPMKETPRRGRRTAARLGKGVSGPPCPEGQRSGNRRESDCISGEGSFRLGLPLSPVYGLPTSLQRIKFGERRVRQPAGAATPAG